MTLGLIFWIIMLVWLLFSGWSLRAGGPTAWGGSLMLFVLLLLLGWHSFGAPIRG